MMEDEPDKRDSSEDTFPSPPQDSGYDTFPTTDNVTNPLEESVLYPEYREKKIMKILEDLNPRLKFERSLSRETRYLITRNLDLIEDQLYYEGIKVTTSEGGRYRYLVKFKNSRSRLDNFEKLLDQINAIESGRIGESIATDSEATSDSSSGSDKTQIARDFYSDFSQDSLDTSLPREFFIDDDNFASTFFVLCKIS